MRVPRRVVIALVLMMFISGSDSKPQNIEGLSPDDNEFINQLVAGDTQVCPSLSESCVHFDDCCDRDTTSTERPFGGSLVTDPTSGAQNIFDLVNPKLEISPCSSKLEICCEKKCNIEVATPSSSGVTTPSSSGIQCGIRNIESFRVTLTGTESTFGEFPWMVAVLTQVENEYVGGGSLVHPRVVLTAAHKVHGKSDFVARIGDWDLSAKTDREPIDHQTINVKNVVPHPQFSRSTLINNIALLILETDAVLGNTVMPICLPEPNQVFDDLDCTASGWGKNELETGDFQTILKKVKVPAVNHADCQSMLRKTRLGSDFNLDDTFNCAGGKEGDTCEGDGGSPLVCLKPNKPNEYVQMGVTAWGIGCGIGNPGVYGSVPKAVDWIKQEIKKINPRG